MDFVNIDYLRNGNSKQRRVYRFLCERFIIQNLLAFDPILVGTIPINIDIETSDLDIICCWENKQVFVSKLESLFQRESGFSIAEKIKDGNEVVVAKFSADGFLVEIYGSKIPTKEQNGYKHMIIEHNILLNMGEEFRLQIVELKKQGYKTEPAFAKLLGLDDNPFSELLKYKFNG